MPDILVQRGTADQRGEDIVESLLTTVEACLARGRNELDSQASGLQDVERVINYIPGIRAGQIIGVTDLNGEHWYGKIKGVSHDYTQTDVMTTVSIARPTV